LAVSGLAAQRAERLGYILLSEAVKKCTTMAGSVAPREWLRHGGPQKQ
jgi:hypothetical protein